MGVLVDRLMSVLRAIESLVEKAPAPKWNLFGTVRYDRRWALLHRDHEAFVDAELKKFNRDPELYTVHAMGLLTPGILAKYVMWRVECWCIKHVVGFGVTA
jgi:hypothetical protein